MDESTVRDAVKPSTQASLRGVLEDVRLIATGGMSQIFRARQPALDRYIVVKKLKDELIANPETNERFRREAKALASVLHQNVAHVYDFVETGRESYLLMEYIDGIDLSMAIDKAGALPPPVAAAILLGVAKGLGYIHAHGLIHRDVKPSNVRLTSRGEVKLMDFGIVLELDNTTLTRPGMMVGSPSYLSPEQVLGDELTPRSDLFLLGICLYEMLAGSRPFRDEAGETIFQRIREAKYTPIRKMRTSLPAALERIVRLCLQKSPDSRYESTKDLILELEAYLGPVRSSHPAEVILAYLESEALVQPSIRLTGDTAHARRRAVFPSVAKGFFIIAMLALVFAAGYRMGCLSGAGVVAPTHTSFPPARPVAPALRRGFHQK